MVKSTKHNSPSYWVAGDNGYEKNSSADVIRKTLTITKKKRKFIVLLHKGYQSGSTVIVEIGKDFLTIDKPVDWPGLDKIRVVFKDEAQVWNYFAVHVVSDTEDTVKTEFPTELFRLQRRAHFRINLPNGSVASFLKNDQEFKNVMVGNLSIGGMMFCLSSGEPPGDLKDQDEINGIVLKIPKEEKKGVAALSEGDLFDFLSVGKGMIVRSFVDSDTVKYCMGVQFDLRAGEEERMQQYVRKRELETLRKGILSD